MKINIIESNIQFKNALSKRSKTDEITLHHACAKGVDVYTIDSWHKGRGWSGIGYHFYVRMDGTIYRGRPIDKVGAHCTNHNNHTVGICFEGNFQEDTMPPSQLEAGQKLISYLFELYGLNSNNVKKHSDHMATACPGANFPFDTIRMGCVASSGTVVNASTPVNNVYTVVKGDTLSGIGKKFNIDWKQIASLNGIKFPYIIKIGQQLKLSDTAEINTGGYNAQITAKSGLNVRSNPNENAKKITAIPKNTKVYISKVENGWGYTSYKGVSGWVYLMYTKKI